MSTIQPTTRANPKVAVLSCDGYDPEILDKIFDQAAGEAGFPEITAKEDW